MSKPVKFYYDLLSQPSRAMVIFLKLARIPYEDLPVALRNGEHLSEDFKNQVNRFQRVPCINDNGFKLSESVAIVRYLANKHKIPDTWYPQDAKKQALVDEYLEWQHNNTRITCALYFQLMWLKPLLTGKKPTEKEVDTHLQRVVTTLDAIENIWLEKTPFLAGNEVTVADLWAACEIEQLTLTPYDFRKGRPRLTAWLEKVRSSSNPHYDEAHKILKKLAEKTSAKL
ncbi:glutathione S-transferase theta-1 [Phlebotomus papatasi]|nr:glutathione S-transferase theta-1 [Phlebotomus papatasi]